MSDPCDEEKAWEVECALASYAHVKSPIGRSGLTLCGQRYINAFARDPCPRCLQRLYAERDRARANLHNTSKYTSKSMYARSVLEVWEDLLTLILTTRA